MFEKPFPHTASMPSERPKGQKEGFMKFLVATLSVVTVIKQLDLPLVPCSKPSR
ncbi:hypothetical protein ACFFJT_03165 [Dyella flava]|uniref:Uncharacterized protein n=1 Tax=Dyella flava TaxID=1920170 RepID=A0ABS2JY28_9GAMM|nr:hypothetical protein [Dyella flava]